MPKKRNITPVEIEFSAKLAARLRGLRCECGLTQAEIAERADIAPNTLSATRAARAARALL